MVERVQLWTPRVIAALYVLMLSLFALDVEDKSVWRAALGVMIHLIPAAILLICTVIAWQHPGAGAVLFALVGIGFTLFFHTYEDWAAFMILSVPLFVASVLFAVDLSQE